MIAAQLRDLSAHALVDFVMAQGAYCGNPESARSLANAGAGGTHIVPLNSEH